MTKAAWVPVEDRGRVREGSANLSERLQEVKLENKALRGTVAGFERVKRAFGPEQVKVAAETIKQREQYARRRRKIKESR